MAKTYPNGVVSPEPGDQIPANGAGAWDTVAASTDAQLGTKSNLGHTHSTSQVTGLASLLSAKQDVEPVELSSGADANTLTTPGRYVETNASDAGTHTNFPEQRAGILDVTANADRLHVWQLWRPYTGNRLYMRSRTGGAWDTWGQLVKSSKVDSLQAQVDTLLAATRDTGPRNIRGDLVNAETISPGGEATIQRIGTRVHLSLYDISFSDSGTVRVVTTLPIGFRPVIREGYSPLISSDIAKRAVVMPTGLYLYSVPTGGGQLRSVLSWTTNNAWPTTLPGTPA